MGELKVTKLNAIKWILKTTNVHDVTQISQNFIIQDRKCSFLFHSGFNTSGDDQKPVSLAIEFHEKEKLNPSVDATILVSTTSKMFFPERHRITGEHKQLIWTSYDYGLRNSLLTFEVFIYDAVLTGDRSIQTTSYIDACILLEDVSKDFGRMFEEGPDHDVEFICDDEIIKAHKSILCSRSKVFASMLQSDMKEAKTGQVKIQDIKSDIFRQFLKCLYTGMLSELTVDTALGFYEAADKYAVDTLKKQCADFLMDNASLENACEILLMADRHSDLTFKKDIIAYIIKVEVPISGEKWADFCEENPTLANEVLNLFCRHLRKKLKCYER